MKLKKFEDKSLKKRKIMLISLGILVLMSVSLVLYKTFAIFEEQVSFPFMDGKVDYYGNSDIFLEFYHEEESLDQFQPKIVV